MNNAVLDGVVMMILISCIISSIATDQAARQLKLSEDTGELAETDKQKGDDEKIMVLVNGSDRLEGLVGAAVMMRNAKLNRGLIGLNVVNDADLSQQAQESSRRCLMEAERIAAASDVGMQTQSRLAVNFVNGTVHAMHENDASEIVMGLHRRRSNVGGSFYGRFAEGLVESMPRQLVIVNFLIPINTITRIVVAVPERAEYENGFNRWMERLARMAREIGCKIVFHATEHTNTFIMRYMKRFYQGVRAEYQLLESWDDLLMVSGDISFEHLFVVVTARPGSLSYQNSFEQLPDQIIRYFSNNSLMIVFPDQQGETVDNTLFSEPMTHSYTGNSKVSNWLSNWIGKMG
jgi:hypothetical protein